MINIEDLIGREIDRNILLVEKRTRNVIVVDVQPIYEAYTDFSFYDYGEFLLKNKNILYFYNGVDSGLSDDTKDSIIDMWDNYNPEVAEKLHSSDIKWIDKGYAFFRSWMDMGADEGFIQQAIRFMTMERVNDSREIDPEVWMDKFPDDFTDDFIDDPLSIPDIPIEDLRLWSGSYLTGGGRKECLREVQLWMNAFNVKYTLVDDFIYG